MSETLLLNVQKAFSLVKELKAMNIEDLISICEQYGEKTTNLAKDDLILLILKNELSEVELADYQKYIKYYSFRQSMTSLYTLENSINKIQDVFSRKKELSGERNRAAQAKREVEMALFNELPLVRLNIEYSHVKRDLDEYISKRTKSGMKIASLADELEYIKSKNIIYRFFKKGQIEDLEKEKHDVRVAALVENDAMYKKYVATVKNYSGELRGMFYKMLDNRLIARAVYLYRNLEMDVSSPDFYKVGHVYDVKFTPEEKEQIYEEFIANADFDPERDVTGPIFYEAVKKYVTKYYSLMEDRIDIKQSQLVSDIKGIVGEQKALVSGIYQDFGMQYGDEGSVLSSLYEEDQVHTKRKK